MMESRWRPILRTCKRALLGPGRVSLAGISFAVVYEARGAWDEIDYPILRQFASRSRCIFDVGAHKGMTALLMASAMPPGGKLYAFEASEQGCNIIRANASLNGLRDVIHVVNALVDERSGRAVEFFWDAASVYASVLRNHVPSAKPVEPLPKATLALDDFARESGAVPDFVKIDTEGAEGGILRGMCTILRDARPLTFVEVHRLPDASVSEHALSLLPSVHAVGYRMITVGTKQEVLSGHPLEDERFRAHALLLPQERCLPDWFASFDTSAL